MRIATALIVLVVASAILVEVGSAVAATNRLGVPKNVARWNLDNAYFSCLTHQVEGLVPSGKRVWVSADTPNGTVDDITLKKVVAPYAPLAYRSTGVVQLFLVQVHGSTKGCLGVRVRAETPDGAVRFGSGSLVGSSLQLPAEQ
jgi:hypothetical protein